MDTALYFQFPASFLTPATIRLGVSAGPEENFRGSRCPVTRIFTLFPPISITSTFMSYSSRLLPHLFRLKQLLSSYQYANKEEGRWFQVPPKDGSVRSPVADSG